MRCLDFFLGLEEPGVDLSGAKQDAVCILIEKKRCQSVFWTIANFIEDGLLACIVSDIPDLDNLVSSKRNQMEPLLVECKVLHTSIMPIQVSKNTKCKWIPHKNMSLLTT